MHYLVNNNRTASPFAQKILLKPTESQQVAAPAKRLPVAQQIVDHDQCQDEDKTSHEMQQDSATAQQLELDEKINAGFTKRVFLNEETGLSLQELTCLYCNVKYGKLSNMKDHIRTHLAVKMFKCSICSKGFVWQGNRDRHERKKVCLPKSVKQALSQQDISHHTAPKTPHRQ